MFTSIPAAIEEARIRRDEAITKHINGKYWPVHFVVSQFRNRLEVLREDKAGDHVLFTTRNERFGTVKTEKVSA